MMLCRDSSRLSDSYWLWVYLVATYCRLKAYHLLYRTNTDQIGCTVCASVLWSEMPKWNATSIHKKPQTPQSSRPAQPRPVRGRIHRGEWLGCRHGTLTASACPKYAATCSSCHRTMEVPGKGYARLKAGTGDFGRSNDGELIVCKSHQKIDVYTYVYIYIDIRSYALMHRCIRIICVYIYVYICVCMYILHINIYVIYV